MIVTTFRRSMFGLVGLSLLAMQAHATARDLGQYNDMNAEQRQWFSGLMNYRGQVCCYDADGLDATWDTLGNHYRVAIDGKMVTVPTDALVTAPNKYGVSKVWLTPGTNAIRCFMPGSQS